MSSTFPSSDTAGQQGTISAPLQTTSDVADQAGARAGVVNSSSSSSNMLYPPAGSATTIRAAGDANVQSSSKVSPSSSAAVSYPSQNQQLQAAGPTQTSSLRAPKSNYYYGPPPQNSAFGTSPVGVIGRDKPREMIRVERDYTSGELCQFHPTFPLELEGRITPTQFSETINDINDILIDAHASGWAFLDNTLAVLTLYLSPLVLGTKYKREMASFTAYIDKANKTLFNPAGLNIVHPRHSAFLFMEIEYF